MKLTAIAQKLNATQIESIDVWAKVLLVKATVNGKTVVRFVSKKLIASEIGAKIASLKAEYSNEDYAHEYANKFGSIENFIKIEMRAAMDAAIAAFNREANKEALESYWLGQLGMSKDQFVMGCNHIDGLTVADARKLFSSQERMDLFLAAVQAIRPWVSLRKAYEPMGVKKFGW